MQSPQTDVCAFVLVMFCKLVRSECIGDVYLDDHDVGFIIKTQFFYMLILQSDLIVSIAIGCKCGKSQWWKQRILNRSPERTLSFGECRKDHLNFHVLLVLVCVI